MEPKKWDKYVMFKNTQNNCWLNAPVTLVAHNKIIKKVAAQYPDSQFNKIVLAYDQAMSILNKKDSEEARRIAEEFLRRIQLSTYNCISPFVKPKFGIPDSAFCALLNLFLKYEPIKKQLSVCFFRKKLCSNCGKSWKSKLIEKPIITLSFVNEFDPTCPTTIYCCSCGSEQEMQLVYKDLPPCLIFHFENGAGSGESLPLNFKVQNRVYHLSCVLTLEESKEGDIKHFVTWIRDVASNMWLECNDLNTEVVSFSEGQPEFDLKEVYMYVYESFDNLDKIEIATEDMTDEQLDDNEAGDELIDLTSEESADIKVKLETEKAGGLAMQNELSNRKHTADGDIGIDAKMPANKKPKQEDAAIQNSVNKHQNMQMSASAVNKCHMSRLAKVEDQSAVNKHQMLKLTNAQDQSAVNKHPSSRPFKADHQSAVYKYQMSRLAKADQSAVSENQKVMPEDNKISVDKYQKKLRIEKGDCCSKSNGKESSAVGSSSSHSKNLSKFVDPFKESTRQTCSSKALVVYENSDTEENEETVSDRAVASNLQSSDLESPSEKFFRKNFGPVPEYNKADKEIVQNINNAILCTVSTFFEQLKVFYNTKS